jgi:hypothetical protein
MPWTSRRSQKAVNSGEARRSRATSPLPRTRLVEVLGHRRAKICDQAADDVVPVDDRHPPVGLREDEPEDVPVLHRDRLEIVEEAGVRSFARPRTGSGFRTASSAARAMLST